MIYALPNTSFITVLSNAATGLTGTLAVRILNGSGETIVARSTEAIIEAPVGSGTYIARRTSPNEVGTFVIIWDKGSTTPATTADETLVVTPTGGPAPLLPPVSPPTPSTKLATVADVKRVLHVTADDNDSITTAHLQSALEAAEPLVTRWLRQDFTKSGGLAPGPAGLGVRAEPSGGHLNLGTYYWRVSATVAGVETAASNETQAEMAQNGRAVLAWQPVTGAEVTYSVFRATQTGGENTSPSLLQSGIVGTSFTDIGEAVKPGRAQGATAMFYDVREDGYVPVPVLNATVVQVRLFRTPKASAYIAIPILDYEVHQDGRLIRLHPTFFDVPFEGAVSVHLPDNWARVEVDYTPVETSVPAPVRDGVAITAAAIYQRGPTSASGFTEERVGDYVYMNRPMRGQGDMTETIPDIAKNLMRPYKRRTQLVP